MTTADRARRTDAAQTRQPKPADGDRAPALRLIPGEGTGQLTLPLEYEVAPGVPAIPPVPAHLHLVGAPEPAVETAAQQPSALPPAGLWTARLARAIAEVAHGERPASQLASHVAKDQLLRLSMRGSAVQRHPSSRDRRGSTRLRQVRGVRICPVAPGVVEASAVLVGGPRAQAIAMRLEAVGDQWLATAVELG